MVRVPSGRFPGPEVIAVPEEAPFLTCVKYVAEQFKVSPATSAVITNEGVGINPNQNAGAVRRQGV